MKRIPTQHHIVRRVAAAFWKSLEDRWYLPLAIAAVLLLIVNAVPQ